MGVPGSLRTHPACAARGVVARSRGHLPHNCNHAHGHAPSTMACPTTGSSRQGDRPSAARTTAPLVLLYRTTCAAAQRRGTHTHARTHARAHGTMPSSAQKPQQAARMAQEGGGLGPGRASPTARNAPPPVTGVTKQASPPPPSSASPIPPGASCRCRGEAGCTAPARPRGCVPPPRPSP